MVRANIPRSDSDAASWMRAFGDKIIARPNFYNLPEELCQQVVDAVAEFRSALAKTLVPMTRSKADTSRKNKLRARAEQLCRHCYTEIRNNTNLSDADKIFVGVRPKKRHRTPSQAPQTAPLLEVFTTNTAHTIVWRDEGSTRRGKPDGCAMLQLYIAVGPERAQSPSQAQVMNVYTGNRVTLVQDHLIPMVPGLKPGVAPPVATFFARWTGPKGQPGPWSRPQSVWLAA